MGIFKILLGAEAKARDRGFLQTTSLSKKLSGKAKLMGAIF